MNIVSIDFDIIMAPSIEFYNNMVGSPNLFNDDLVKVFTADLVHYQRLTQWLMKQLSQVQPENIICIVSHEKLIDYVSEGDTIINIDHHHDLGYKNADNKKLNKINCGNWAKHLLEEKIIQNYIWIKNENSNIVKEYDGSIKEYNLKNYQLDNLKADKIILCLSPEWITPQFKPLFFAWIDILNEYYHTDFFLN